jgi:hypothetical protein
MIFTDTYMMEIVRGRLAQANMSNIESSSTLSHPLESLNKKRNSGKDLMKMQVIIAARKSYV